ncbi:MAG: hypothetical protein KatS3mg131_0587 [Candidatus Tectimicrobiota bacterium]|nr:MAG: hypothetical protein KatS3mg131_0587 [Candidatus Tectomicrobia bacterium]
MLRRFARLSPPQQYTGITGVLLALLALLSALAWWHPLYLRALSSEWGLLEPLTFWLYWLATWIAVSLARLYPRPADKPYRLLVFLCVLAFLEECDYLGIFGGLIGRIDGVYVGAIHDLLNLWYRTGRDPRWLVLALAGMAVLTLWLWHRGYLGLAVLRREVLCLTTVPFWVGLSASGSGPARRHRPPPSCPPCGVRYAKRRRSFSSPFS